MTLKIKTCLSPHVTDDPSARMHGHVCTPCPQFYWLRIHTTFPPIYFSLCLSLSLSLSRRAYVLKRVASIPSSRGQETLIAAADFCLYFCFERTYLLAFLSLSLSLFKAGFSCIYSLSLLTSPLLLFCLSVCVSTFCTVFRGWSS